MRSLVVLLLGVLSPLAKAAPAASAGPLITLNYGTFQGNTVDNVDEFLGMPFAAPPVGNLRFAPPQPPLSFSGVQQATQFGAMCFQQTSNLTVLGVDFGAGVATAGASAEDCLFINVVRPTNTPAGANLPVLFWIYGGGFADGDTSNNPGDTVVARSIALNEPVVYVSANYRLNAFGFLGGQQVKDAGLGNIGLRDQRFAMAWVQSHISAFGGDPTKVIIWGESAGAVSIGAHFVINDGNPEGLFRGAFMESGSPLPMRDITILQPIFDGLVANTGCTGAADPIACLRSVSFEDLGAAVNVEPNILSFMSLQLSWQPTIDGVVITQNPQISVLEGKYAKVPFITGDCDDEGTIFSLSTLNLTTNPEFLSYVQSNYFENELTPDELTAIALAYPSNATQGSPFNTGTANELTPEFKRIASFQGDLIFQAPRRFFLATASKTQTAFAFLFKRGKAQPFIGSFHGSDIPEFYGTGTDPDFVGTDALVNFANTLNPTTPSNPNSLLSTVDWQPWASSAINPPLLTFLDPAPSIAITADTFRAGSIALLEAISLQAQP